MRALESVPAFLRSVLVLGLFPLAILVLAPLIIGAHYIFRSKKLEDALVSFWGRLSCRMAGVRVEVRGQENIPAGGCLFLFNHTSFFDVFAIVGYIPGIRFGAKAELFKIPLFAQAMRAAGTLPIARDNRDEVYKVYEEARARFARGDRFALSPEGGRFYGPALSPFKAGPFLFAMSAGVPVVPVVLEGAYEALPKGEFLFNRRRLRHTIVIHILAPVSTADYTPETRKELQAVVYERMNAVWAGRGS